MEGVIVDGTLGDGGHTESILKNTGPKTKVLGIDRDLYAIERARKRLQPFRDRVIFAHSSLENLQDIVAKSGVTRINGLLLDFGVSSPQLDTPERGFSIRHDGPLDMRMDNSQKTTAANLLEAILLALGYQYLETTSPHLMVPVAHAAICPRANCLKPGHRN